MRPVFCGNFDHDTRQYDLERLFSKYGPISRIDMKIGYAFIYFEDERDAEDAIRRLDNVSFGYDRRRLSVEWSRQVEPVPKSRDRPTGDVKPTRTLFVINFDPMRTKIQDIERHFEPYGKIANIRIRRNFAFVQYETQEEASAAVKNTNKSTILDRVVTVEYAFRDDDSERDDRYGSPKRGAYDRRRGNPYMRSPSPRYRREYSPDYDRRGRYPGYDRRDGAMYERRSPVYDRYNRGRSPVYDRYDRGRSPVYDRYDRRRSPDYDQY
ncbi:serine/arginine-rich splicing factor RS31-like [Miscanthus floridulus]|uniref:serine/arginine-rich splicing factor RS31-like n=1 Tax=Miscanthus floridulus TaxID=154761 RepID=UPI00345A4685